jgi:hypothetical protein
MKYFDPEDGGEPLEIYSADYGLRNSFLLNWKTEPNIRILQVYKQHLQKLHEV